MEARPGPSCTGADAGGGGGGSGLGRCRLERPGRLGPRLSLRCLRLTHTLLGAYLAGTEGIPSCLRLKGQAPPTRVFGEVVGKVA